MRATRTAPLALSIVLVALALLAPAAAQALPRGFFGIAPQTAIGAADTARMRAGGLETIRASLGWSGVESSPRGGYNWAGFDELVRTAARDRLEVLPFLYSTPHWVSGDWRRLPVDGARARRAWSAFVGAAVERYGRGGEFWREHGPGSDDPLPYLPIRAWQIWNEENFFYFTNPASPQRYARLLALSRPAVKRVDPRADVVIGGLFGDPAAGPPRALDATDFLDQLYRVGGVKANFDAVALHPYAADTADLRRLVEGVRATMVRHGDRRSGLYLTELGWGSQANSPVSFEVGLRGQARELRDAYRYLLANRGRLKLQQVVWFSWKDAPGSCSFCDSVGLFRQGAKFRPKPAWRALRAIAR
ncbi:MAG TPA: hypothetical protein VFX85_10975 [Solirubrobacterales bacterium]|nr:hypothetical protein [Solirubrobacterales bacterium]